MKPLTSRQSAAVHAAHERWRKWIYSTEPAGGPQAEDAVCYTHRMAAVSGPKHFMRLFATRRASRELLNPDF
jgi:hypothetical protein